MSKVFYLYLLSVVKQIFTDRLSYIMFAHSLYSKTVLIIIRNVYIFLFGMICTRILYTSTGGNINCNMISSGL